jgi:hypothetical protein
MTNEIISFEDRLLARRDQEASLTQRIECMLEADEKLAEIIDEMQGDLGLTNEDIIRLLSSLIKTSDRI